MFVKKLIPLQITFGVYPQAPNRLDQYETIKITSMNESTVSAKKLTVNLKIWHESAPAK